MEKQNSFFMYIYTISNYKLSISYYIIYYWLRHIQMFETFKNFTSFLFFSKPFIKLYALNQTNVFFLSETTDAPYASVSLIIGHRQSAALQLVHDKAEEHKAGGQARELNGLLSRVSVA